MPKGKYETRADQVAKSNNTSCRDDLLVQLVTHLILRELQLSPQYSGLLLRVVLEISNTMNRSGR